MPAFVKTLGAVPVELFLLEVGLGVVEIGLGCLFRGDVGGDIGVGGGDGGRLAGYVRFLLDAFNGGNFSPCFTWSPSLT